MECQNTWESGGEAATMLEDVEYCEEEVDIFIGKMELVVSDGGRQQGEVVKILKDVSQQGQVQ